LGQLWLAVPVAAGNSAKGRSEVKIMKLVKNIVLAALVWVGVAAAFASAQVIKQVPSNALVVLKVSDLETTSKKVADFAAAMGISQMDPDMADPLGAFLKAVGAPDGVNRSGELAFAYVDPTAYNTVEEKSFLMLIPVSDYQKFIGNFPDAKPDGDLTQAHFKNQNNEVTYFAHWGDYAAASPTRDIVAKTPTDIIQFDGLAAKELDGKDIVLLGNLKGLRPKMLQAIDSGRQQAPGEIDQLVSQALKAQGENATKFAPLAKELAGQILDFAQQFAQSADAASFSVNLSPDGIATTFMCQFDPASSLGTHVTEVKNTDESLLNGLATGKYLLFGGASPQQVAEFWAKFLPPIQKAITDMGPDYSSLNDWLNAVQKMSTASTGSTFGLMMPQSQPGAGALLQFVSIRRGDAKTILDGQREMSDAQQKAFKAVGLQMMATAQTYTKDSKIVDGISFDEMKGQINMNGQSPQAMQAMQFINLIYGPQGPDAFTGVVNDQTLLTVMGLDDAAISTAITAAKAGTDPLAKTSAVKTVSSELPAQRFAVMYVPLDLWATTGFGYAKMFGIDMGVVLPDNLPPMGTALSTDGTAVRADTYIPSQLIQALTAAGMQVYMKTQNVGGPPQNGGGGAAPGGM
jgi:hypothetical protein